VARQVNWFTEDDVRRWDRRQVLKLGAGAAVTAALAGRTAGALAAPSAAGVSNVGEGKTIGLILNGFNVYDQCLATGVLKGLAGTKYGFIGLQGNFDAAQEVDNFDTMISRGVEGIIVIPNTVQGASRGALAAKSKGIPVVNVLWSDPTPADSAYVARVRADNIRGGNLMAQWITKNTDPGEIVVVIGVPGQGFSEKLLQGLKEGLDVYGEGKWKIVGIQPGFFTRTTAIKAAQNLLTAHPKAKIIVDFAAEMGNGIASYLKKSGKTDIVNITSDGNEEMVPLISSGGIKAVRYYSSAQEGLVGAQLMRKYLEKGQKTPGIVDLKQGMVTSANIDQWVKEQPLCYDQYHGRVSKIG
jgi:ribose transport system substrate-binding protein